MKTVVVTSGNPVKFRAAERGFQRMLGAEALRVEALAVASGVDRQPMTDAETLRGAENRVREAARLRPDADFWIGLEGGIEDDGDTMIAFAWVVVGAGERLGRSRTATFALPPRVAELVRAGHELGHADDLVFGRSNSKQNDGAVGLLTRNVIDRAELYEPAVVLALIPFLNRELYPAP